MCCESRTIYSLLYVKLLDVLFFARFGLGIGGLIYNAMVSCPHQGDLVCALVHNDGRGSRIDSDINTNYQCQHW